MFKRRRGLKRMILGMILLPTIAAAAISAIHYRSWLQQTESVFAEEKTIAQAPTVLNEEPPTAVILEDDFSNNAAGWTLINSAVNKWHAGFPSQFLTEGEENLGLMVSDNYPAFSYTANVAAVSHAYKSITLEEGTEKISVSFDWVGEGYAFLDMNIWVQTPYDYLRVWVVPDTFVPTADVAITAAASQGLELTEEPFLSNGWAVTRNTTLLDITALNTRNIKVIFEWVNAGNPGGSMPLAVRNLRINNATCQVVADFPFLENFEDDSLTRHCWSIVDQNGDEMTWTFGQTYFEDEEGNYVYPNVAYLHTAYADSMNDDWLISPTFRLTGNQRLRYQYRVNSSTKPNDFRVVLSTSGTETDQFTRVLVPLTTYNNTQLVEEVVRLTDAEGNLITGDVNLAWHVPPGGPVGERIMITNVQVEDIPACSPARNLTITDLAPTSATVSWRPGDIEEEWEVVVQPLGDPVPTAGTRVTTSTYAVENLERNTDYVAYVRAKCSADEFSEWIGPKRFRTLLEPVELPYSEDFENNPTFGFSNDTLNKWVIGTAVHNGGTTGLYISNDQGVTNAYTMTTNQVSHVYKDIELVDGVVDLSVQFDWRNVGEEWNDYFKVWLVPVSYIPTEGREITASSSNGLRLDTSSFYRNAIFKHENLEKNISRFAGQTMRLVFEWINNDWGGVQPPAAIDNINVEVTQCVKPTELAFVRSDQESAEITWTNAAGVAAYDIFVGLDDTPPTMNATPTYTNVTAPYTLTNLQPNTRYFVWVRSACSATNKSFWLGPLHFLTQQIPAELPFIDNFEGDPTWSMDIGAKNRWFVGFGTSNEGAKSLYISSNDGVANLYNTNEYSISHAYRDIFIPEGTSELTIQYNWRAQGEVSRNSGRDFFRLLQIPLTTIPQSREQLPVNRTHRVVGRPFYANSGEWGTAHEILNVSDHQGETLRFVFEWVNDYSGGEQPPAAIDNINIVASSCPSPIDLKTEIIRHTSKVRLSWTPQGDETKWEVFTTLQGNAGPGPDTPGILVEGEPTLVLEDVEPGQYFVFYVRVVCEDENGETKTVWIGPETYSYFLPPMCAELDGGIIGMPVAEDNNYIICEDGPVQKTLEAHYFDIKNTNEYVVESIDYNPPFPFFGGDMVDLVEDDVWSDVIELGFDFCFYGNSYNKVIIGTNGMISFSIKDVVEGGIYEPLSPSGFEFGLPLPSGTGEIPYQNAIFGVMQDLFPETSPDDYSVNYQILGAFPCRALVFNMYHMGLYNIPYDQDNIEGSTQTSQIVLYEATNIIEVYVKNRPVLPVSDQRHNNANGVIGIQNADGTQAHYPGMYDGDTVNRNTGDWTASNEAWRFTPSGASSVNFTWLKDGEPFSKEEVITVDITKSVNYTARATYEACEGNELVIERVFNFIKEDFAVPELPNLYVCGSIEDVNQKVSIDLTPNKTRIFDALGAQSESHYSVAFFKDEALTIPVEQSISVEAVQTVYVNVTRLSTGCSKVVQFDAVRIAPIIVTKLENVEVCGSYTLPVLAEGEQYYTAPLGKGTAYQGGTVYTTLGTSTLYIYKAGERDCYGESSFTILIYEPIVADVIENQIMSCDNFVLPALSEGNTYYTKPNGEGVELRAGEKIILPTTLYIYAKRGSKTVFCTDESSFTVDFEDCPIPKGFSPNGDGINDSFDLSDYGVSKIQIFNRHGREVYSKNGEYTNEFIGKDKGGSKLPSGTYYYVLVSRGKLKTGWVQINY